jgi:hypothetical protein
MRVCTAGIAPERDRVCRATPLFSRPFVFKERRGGNSSFPGLDYSELCFFTCFRAASLHDILPTNSSLASCLFFSLGIVMSTACLQHRKVVSASLMMHRCASSGIKRAFCTPFKEGSSSVKTRSLKGEGDVQRCILCSPNLSDDAADPSFNATFPRRGGFFEELQEPEEAECVEANADVAHSGVSNGRVTHSLEEKHDRTRHFLCCTKELVQRQKANALVTHHGGGAGERSAMADDTLYWIGASQKALRHLADTLADGDVERVLVELHIDASSVLYSADKGDFMPPQQFP